MYSAVYIHGVHGCSVVCIHRAHMKSQPHQGRGIAPMTIRASTVPLKGTHSLSLSTINPPEVYLQTHSLFTTSASIILVQGTTLTHLDSEKDSPGITCSYSDLTWPFSSQHSKGFFKNRHHNPPLPYITSQWLHQNGQGRTSARLTRLLGWGLFSPRFPLNALEKVPDHHCTSPKSLSAPILLYFYSS